MFKILIFYLFLITNIITKDIITWYKVSFPPFVITEGNNIGEGTVDKIMEEIYFANLQEYEHKIEVTNLNRLMNNLKMNNYVANPILFKNNEREEFAYFSKPFDFTISNHLIVSKENEHNIRPYIDSEGFVDFKSLIKSKNFKVAVESGRYYSDEINEVIKENINTKYIDLGYGDLVEASSRKLLHGRIDAFIEHPEIAEYIIRLKEINIDYSIFPIKGTGKYNVLRFSFPKTTWGLSMVKRINSLIDEFIYTDEYYELALRWSKNKEKYMDEFRQGMKEKIWD